MPQSELTMTTPEKQYICITSASHICLASASKERQKYTNTEPVKYTLLIYYLIYDIPFIKVQISNIFTKQEQGIKSMKWWNLSLSHTL